MRIVYAGESHMEAMTAVIEGFPAGFAVDINRINKALSLRQMGYGRGARMNIELDRAEIISGIINGITIGSPITILIPNSDNRRKSWEPDHITTVPRPGHGDLAGAVKFGFQDMRLVAERASARQTAPWVAVGALCAQLLESLGIRSVGYVESIGKAVYRGKEDPMENIDAINESPFRLPGNSQDGEFRKEIDSAKESGDTLGGCFRVLIRACPPGLGSYATEDQRLSSRLTSAIMSIPSLRGVEIGLGFNGAHLRGSQYHDPIIMKDGRIHRPSNNAGGIEGGMSNGEDILIRGVAKPIPTLSRPLQSVDMAERNPAPAPVVRSDTCAIPAISVIAKAVTDRIMASAVMERFGGETWEMLKKNYRSHPEYGGI